MSFFTAVNCMDGRVQLPVFSYLQKRFGVQYIDMITEQGPVSILSGDLSSQGAKSIFRRIDISVEKHRSSGIVVVAHADCAGNPLTDEAQRDQLHKSLEAIRQAYPEMKVLGLWADKTWTITEIEND